jgi:prepilin-type N-terminal cleavage/methylation domain-containing protein
MKHSARIRAGFTLIELIVVVSIIAILASLIVGVAVTASNKDKAGTGATALVGWLKEAQALALRDQKPYGLRLFVNGGTNLVSTAQLIEQPDDWMPPIGANLSSSVSGSTITFTATFPQNTYDFSGGWGGSPSVQWPVQQHDYLEWGSGTPSISASTVCVLPITPVSSTAPTATTAGTGVLTATLPADAYLYTPQGPSNWRIVRQPRIKTGDQVRALPNDVVVDLNTNSTYGSPLPYNLYAGNIVDILFAPSGAVITPGAAGQDIRLWVLDSAAQPPAYIAAPATVHTYAGPQFIVSVAIRTGFIQIQPVDVTGAGSGTYTTPYSYVQTPINSGF